MGGFASDIGTNLFNPIPIDPITTAIDEKLPRGLQTVVNPAGPALKGVVGKKNAEILLDPVGVGALNPQGAQKQADALLAQGSDQPLNTKTLLG